MANADPGDVDGASRREYRITRGRERSAPDELTDATRTAAADVNAWAKYTVEYVGPVAWMALTKDTAWTLDFSLTNRGDSEQVASILLTEFDYSADQALFFIPEFPCWPGRAFVVNASFVSLGAPEWEGWWARIFASSPDVVPSLHFYADRGSDSPGGPTWHPDHYFSPGDFQAFQLPGGFETPIIGPATG